MAWQREQHSSGLEVGGRDSSPGEREGHEGWSTEEDGEEVAGAGAPGPPTWIRSLCTEQWKLHPPFAPLQTKLPSHQSQVGPMPDEVPSPVPWFSGKIVGIQPEWGERTEFLTGNQPD